MSTRSITTLIDDFTGKEIVAIYRHVKALNLNP